MEFLYPANNARVTDGTDLTIDIVARDNTVGIQRIELKLDGQFLNEAVFPVESVYRVEMNWFANGIGGHVLSVTTYRPDGTPSDEEFLTIEVISPGP